MSLQIGRPARDIYKGGVRTGLHNEEGFEVEDIIRG